ncbi:hypothetical protein GCM10009664_37110 [Kitasatospora gansuensis]
MARRPGAANQPRPDEIGCDLLPSRTEGIPDAALALLGVVPGRSGVVGQRDLFLEVALDGKAIMDALGPADRCGHPAP